MRVFWVNQGQTFDEERQAGALWAPKLSRPRNGQGIGTPRAHWDRLLEAAEGDLVIHYSRSAIRGWSTVTGQARDAPPPFDHSQTPWSVDGRLLPVDFQHLEGPVLLDDIPLTLRTEQDSPSWPFTTRGTVKQVYLSEVTGPLADWLLQEVGLIADAASLPAWPELSTMQATFDYRGDRRVLVHVRSEQARLRRHLFGEEPLAVCNICGRDLPIAMLVTAHIKRRAEATSAERGRLDNVMAACRLGCDPLFELGYIVVGRRGVVERGPRHVPMTPDLRRAIEAVVGRTCSVWTEATEEFFAHHRQWQSVESDRYGLS